MKLSSSKNLEEAINYKTASLFVITGLLFLFLTLSVSILSYYLKIGISQYQIIISAVITIFSSLIFAYILDSKNSLKLFVKGILITSSVFLACIGLASTVTDMSFDGQGYHQAITYSLEKGWNPIHENITDRKDIILRNGLWVDAYPNANSIISLNIYRVTNNLEAAKGLTLFLIVLSSVSAFIALRKWGLHSWLSGLLVLIISLNPVNLLQIFTFGLDSQFYSLLVLVLSSIAIFIKKRSKIYLLILGMSLVLIINNKLVSIFYAGLFCGVISLSLILNKSYYNAVRIIVVSLASAVLAVFVFGFHPFITSTIEHHNPLYPVYSFSKEQKPYDFTENRPSDKRKSNQVVLFFESFFFATNGNFRYPEDISKSNMPFSFTTNQINALIQNGPKQGGFGVLFSGLLITTLLLAVTCVFKAESYTGSKKEIYFVLISLVAIVFSCIINPLNSVARYIPQLWLIFPLLIWFSWYFKHRLIIVFNIATITILLMNSLLAFNVAARYSYQRSLALNQRLEYLSQISKSEPLIVDFDQSEGNHFLLKSHNINFIEASGKSKLKCSVGQKQKSLLSGIGSSTATACLKD